jgi:hypothetical protein
MQWVRPSCTHQTGARSVGDGVWMQFPDWIDLIALGLLFVHGAVWMALCDRLADGLSLNNPARFELMDLAENFVKRAKESVGAMTVLLVTQKLGFTAQAVDQNMD